jgi:hypothetical protein
MAEVLHVQAAADIAAAVRTVEVPAAVLTEVRAEARTVLPDITAKSFSLDPSITGASDSERVAAPVVFSAAVRS